MVVSRNVGTTSAGEGPAPQPVIGAGLVGDAPEPQLRIAATNAVLTEAASRHLVAVTDAAGMRRRASAECRRQTLISQPGLPKRHRQHATRVGRTSELLGKRRLPST